MLEASALLLSIPALLLIGWWWHRHRRLAQKQRQALREAEHGLVGCFTCGMKIPRDSALEKKGRYFCGVKKQQRERADNHHGNTD
jgi:hypothetical protein